MINRTEKGIYYLHNYIPSRNFSKHSDEENEESKMMWAYKDGSDPKVSLKYTKELMQAIAELSQDMVAEKIGLVAVPPSKVEKYSPIRESIKQIADWYRLGIAKNMYHCNKMILDCGNLIFRTHDIPTSHNERRATYKEQMDSLSCKRDELSKLWTTFIILDDVTTTGKSLDACRNVLLDHGAVSKYIYRMAIAKTYEEDPWKILEDLPF